MRIQRGTMDEYGVQESREGKRSLEIKKPIL